MKSWIAQQANIHMGKVRIGLTILLSVCLYSLLLQTVLAIARNNPLLSSFVNR